MTDSAQHPRLQFFSHAPNDGGTSERVGHYLLAESDRFRVYKHIGGEPSDTHQPGYYRVVAIPSQYEFVFGPDGKLKGDDVLWITPRLAAQAQAGDVGDLRHCLDIWLRETVLLKAEPSTVVLMSWIIAAIESEGARHG